MWLIALVDKTLYSPRDALCQEDTVGALGLTVGQHARQLFFVTSKTPSVAIYGQHVRLVVDILVIVIAQKHRVRQTVRNHINLNASSLPYSESTHCTWNICGWLNTSKLVHCIYFHTPKKENSLNNTSTVGISQTYMQYLSFHSVALFFHGWIKLVFQTAVWGKLFRDCWSKNFFIQARCHSWCSTKCIGMNANH